MNVNFYKKNRALLLTFATSLLLFSCNKEESDLNVSPTITSVEITKASFESYNGKTLNVPFKVSPADYPLEQSELFMGVYNSNITKSTSSEYPPFIEEFSIHELIETEVEGEWIATVRTLNGNYYADADIAIAIRQLNSAGDFEYFLSSTANVSTKPSLSPALINITPNTNSISLKNSNGGYQSTTFNIAAAALSDTSSNFYNISDMKVIADSVYLSDANGKADKLGLFSLEKIDDYNWKVTPNSSIEDTISNTSVTAYVRYMLTDVITTDTIEVISSASYFQNSLEAKEKTTWTLAQAERFDFNKIAISSYLSQLGITEAMLEGDENIEKIASSVSFTKTDGSSVDGYCEYDYFEADSLLPEAVEIKFYNDLVEIGDYKIDMHLEYGLPDEEAYINADLTLNLEVIENPKEENDTEVTEQ